MHALAHFAARSGRWRAFAPYCRLSAALLACSWLSTAAATDWELDADARVVSSDGGKSFLEGGLVRFGEEQSGLRLGRARLALSQALGEVWALHLDASAWGDHHDKSPVGATEAYLQFRPYPRAGFRVRAKAGAFYAPISLENRAAGWESPYTLSYSAIDSWVADELRTVGVEAQVEWLGTRTGHPFDLGLTGGVFGWNEQAGQVLATEGFTLHDRQTPLFGRLGQPGVPPLKGEEPFHEIDGRAGVYGGAEARYRDRLVLRALRYDNRADPAAVDALQHATSWHTTFNSVGLRAESANGWTGIVQEMDGYTDWDLLGEAYEWPFNSSFALVSKRIGRHRLTARYDRFEVRSRYEDEAGSRKGHAWTAAYVLEPNAHWRLTLEWLRVLSASSPEYFPRYVPTVALARQTQLQLAIRYALGSFVN